MTRLLRDYSPYAEQFFVDPSFFTVIDTFGIEIIYPRREGRSKQQIGKKGVSNGRWIVGIKLAWLLNREGRVVGWHWDTAEAPDNTFRGLATMYDGQTIAIV